MSILVVGSIAFDSIATPFGEVDRVIGGSATYFSVAASYFTQVNVVAVVGEDFTDQEMSVFDGRAIDSNLVFGAAQWMWRPEVGADGNRLVRSLTRF